ncbi:MAG TPA: fused MFS/spermidine synthase, partial [Bacteroidales bacterium]|nr:fused MFS/spermidine synthase [Bacteroidales bacterium]
MKKHMLEITVFFCGAVVMIYEIVGSRVVAPYFGTSIYVWTSLIGVILASLSLGYWLGGKLADKNPTYRQLAYIIFGSAMFIIVSVTLKDLILNFLSGSFNGMMWRSLFAAVLIFAPASIFLGMVSPYAVRLKIRDVKSSGKTVGNLYAISTIGSILGTFLAGFLLIPLIGTANIMYSLAALLSVLAFTLYVAFMGKGDSIFFFIVFIAAGYGLYEENTLTKEFVEADTRYNHVQIFDMDYWITGERIKVMKVNDEYSSAMFPDSDSLVYEYLRYFRLAEHFNPGFRNALMIGGAAFSYPRYFLDRYPDANIDVVEIDPGLTRLAKEHFRLLENARMRIFHEDGRTFLNRQEGKYDLILGDAYKSLLAVPFQLTTLEATKRKFDLLSDDGIVIENIIASLDGPASAFLKAEIATIRKIFPQVYIFACHDPLDPQLLQSITLVALKS